MGYRVRENKQRKEEKMKVPRNKKIMIAVTTIILITTMMFINRIPIMTYVNKCKVWLIREWKWLMNEGGTCYRYVSAPVPHEELVKNENGEIFKFVPGAWLSCEFYHHIFANEEYCAKVYLADENGENKIPILNRSFISDCVRCNPGQRILYYTLTLTNRKKYIDVDLEEVATFAWVLDGLLVNYYHESKVWQRTTQRRIDLPLPQGKTIKIEFCDDPSSPITVKLNKDNTVTITKYVSEYVDMYPIPCE